MTILEKTIYSWGHCAMNTNKSPLFKNVVTGTLVLFFSVAMTFGQTHFSGFAGVAGNIGGKENGSGARFEADAFFAGQFDLLGRFQLRTEASVKTSDLLAADAFKDVPATFSIDELSLTVRLPSANVSHYLAVFAGEYESIGSDLFLQRQFGIKPLASKITESWLRLNGTTIYPFSGFGGSYVLRFGTPQALGAYVYVNEKNDLRHLNFDLRFGGVLPVVTTDISFGFGFPIETKDSAGNEVIVLIRKMEFHAGITTLIGNERFASLFLQVGLNKIVLKPDENEKALKLSDFYFLIEPRFKANFMNFHFTLFNLPERIVDDLFFISNNLGCNLGIFAENVYVGMFNLTMGAHLTVSVKDATLEKLDSVDINKDNISFQVAPFAETSLSNGTLMARLTMDFMQIQELHKTIEFTLGYKVRL